MAENLVYNSTSNSSHTSLQKFYAPKKFYTNQKSLTTSLSKPNPIHEKYKVIKSKSIQASEPAISESKVTYYTNKNFDNYDQIPILSNNSNLVKYSGVSDLDAEIGMEAKSGSNWHSQTQPVSLSSSQLLNANSSLNFEKIHKNITKTLQLNLKNLSTQNLDCDTLLYNSNKMSQTKSSNRSKLPNQARKSLINSNVKPLKNLTLNLSAAKNLKQQLKSSQLILSSNSSPNFRNSKIQHTQLTSPTKSVRQIADKRKEKCLLDVANANNISNLDLLDTGQKNDSLARKRSRIEFNSIGYELEDSFSSSDLDVDESVTES